MKKSDIKLMLLVALFIAVTFISINLVRKMKNKAVTLAKELHQNYGGTPETSLYDFLYTIWRNVGYSDAGAKSAITNRTAWSAAFISYAFKDYPDFPKSASHSNYIVKSRDNEQNGTGTFRLKRTEEYKPKVGDIVCKNRNGGNYTYDSIYKGAQTHCDIVTEVRDNEIVTIGGNVSDTVKITKVSTSNGYINKSGYFAIISNLN